MTVWGVPDEAVSLRHAQPLSRLSAVRSRWSAASVDLDAASGEAAVRAGVLPQRVRWFGPEPDPRPPSTPPWYLRISYAYPDANLAATASRDRLRGAY